MRIAAVAGLALSVALLAPWAGAKSPRRDPWKQLRRPLHLPSVANGQPCPTSAARRVTARFGVALADAPPYPSPFPHATMRLDFDRERGDGWFRYRTVWLAPPRFAGRVLVRGRRLDQPGELRFSNGPRRSDVRELRMTLGQGPRWRVANPRTRYTLVRSPGCYGFQVDGLDFSNTLVFEARL